MSVNPVYESDNTTNGDTPTSSSTEYTTSFNVASNTVVKAIAYDDVDNTSPVGTFTYTIDTNPPNNLASDKATDFYNAAITVTLSADDDVSSSENITIYYTTNGDSPTVSSTEYTAPFSISSDTVLKFIAKDEAGNISSIAEYTYTIDTVNPADPTATPGSGTYSSEQNVVLSATDDKGTASVYYTMTSATGSTPADPADPTDGDTLYASAINIAANTTVKIKAIAYDQAGNVSNVVMFTYTIDTSAVNPPTALADAGSYASGQSVVLSADGTCTGLCKIYYTTNGDPATISSTEYSAAINVNADMTIKTIAVNGIGTPSTEAVFNYIIDTQDPTDPTAAPGTGIYGVAQNVVLSSTDDNGTPSIYYTTDGSTPDDTDTKYTAAINVSSDLTIKAIAYDSVDNTSNVATFTYTFDSTAPVLQTPSPDPASSPFNTNINVTLTATDDNDPSPTIYYTIDGSTPTTSSTEFTAAFELTTDKTVKAIAVDQYGNESGVSTYNYVVDTIDPADPTSNVASGTYNADQSVELSSSDDHGTVEIYYTTDGSIPDDTDTKYTVAINVSADLTIKAIAYDAADNTSNVSTFTYVIDKTAPGEPVANPTTGLSNVAIPVTLSSSDGTATIYYTTDGSTPTSGSIEYTGSFNIDSGTDGIVTLKAIAIDTATNSSTVGTFTYTIDKTKPAIPTATDPAGTYSTTKSVTLASSDTNGINKIYYTTDGSDPTSSGTRIEYTAAIAVNSSMTIKSAALDNAGNYSNVGTHAYVIDTEAPTTPTADPAGGTYNIAKDVTLSATDNSGSYTIHYTTDGSNPTIGSPTYSSAINVASSKTIKAIAADAAGNTSGIGTFSYVIDTEVPTTPVASPAGGTFATSQSVSLSSSDNSGSYTIYYTTDGSIPTSGSTKYTVPFTVGASLTLKAIAYDNATNASAVGSWTFTISGDSTPPVILTGPNAINITPTAADIVWTTDENATSQVEYSTTAGFTIGTGTTVPATDPDGANNTSHTVNLISLSSSTIYYYRVITKDSNNNTTTSSEYSFMTGSVGDITDPVITSVNNSTPDCNSVNISWNTDEDATSQVEYSTSSGFTIGTGTRVPATDPDGANKLFHSVSVTGLTTNTTYYYKVISKDASGNEAISSEYSFITASSCDTVSPTISDVFVSGISDVSATINWTTDEVATSQIEYSTSSGFTVGTGTKSPLSDPDGANNTNHSITLTGLSSTTTYYFRVISKDAAGNESISSEYSFTTQSSGMDGWETVNPPTACSGASFGHSKNTVTIFNGEVYFGGENVSSKADIAKSDYTQTNITCSGAGLGNNSFVEVTSAGKATFGGTEYIYFASNGSQPAGLSRSLDGSSYTDLASGGGGACTSAGFGDSSNREILAMLGGDGYMYLGTRVDDTSGAKLYVADSDGLSCDFSPGSGSGYIFQGSSTETQISSIALYNGDIYIGVKDTNGAKIYKQSHSPSLMTTTNWTDVTPTFDGGETVTDITAMQVYNGELWFGTENANGAELYNYDGSTHTKVFDFNGTDNTNKSIEWIEGNAVSRLYFGTRKTAGTGGAEIWRSTDAGVNFTQTGTDGFGNSIYNAVSAAGSTGDTIYFLMNDEAGNTTAIFRKTD